MTADRARHRMVEALRASGRVRSPAVEDAFRAVPRHLFLPDLPIAEAYADEAIAVQLTDGVATSSASQPSMMAIMLEQLALRPGHRVLEIGAGTGFNAALMARIVGPAGSVTAVDIDADLVASATAHLAAAGVTGCELVCADGALGHPAGAPYDRIVLTVGSSDVRAEWVTQLAAGGRLLLPLALRGSQLSVALDLGADGLLRSASVRSCAFIRLRGLGAGAETSVRLGDGYSMQLPEDVTAPPDPGVVAAALADPGPVRTTPVPLSPLDVWDGFGLWLALADTHTVRLSGADVDGPLADGMFPVGSGLATVALVGPGPAVATAGPTGDGNAWPRPGCVHAFGSGGSGGSSSGSGSGGGDDGGDDPAAAAPADRMLAALAGWDAAGRPQAADLRLVVSPPPGPVEPAPGSLLVRTPHSVVMASWPGQPASAC